MPRAETKRAGDLVATSDLSRGATRLCAGLAVFDFALAAVVLAAPNWFLRIFQPGLLGHPTELLYRTGALWTVFMLVELLAARWGARSPEWFLAVAVLRLLDVPADPVWLITGHGFTWFGVLGLVVAPSANLASGVFLIRTYRRLTAPAQPST